MSKRSENNLLEIFAYVAIVVSAIAWLLIGLNNHIDAIKFSGRLIGGLQLIATVLTFIVPILTMRIFAEERRVGSIETLMTLPVTELDTVIGKYLSSFIGTLIMLAPTLLFIIPAEIYGSPDYGPIVGGFIGAIFLCASFTAIGIFTSAITKNQIIAFLAGIAICIALTLIDFLLVFLPASVSAVLGFLSAKTHFTSVSRGTIDSRDFIYFISLTALFFAGTVKVQQNAKA